MKVKFKIAIACLVTLALFAGSFLFIETHDIVVLNPMGVIAEQQRSLFFTALFLMLIVVVPVFFMLLFFAWKYRQSNEKASYKPDWSHNVVAESLWWGVPFCIIVVLAVVTWVTTHQLNPFKPLDSGKKPLEIQVIALKWKWLFLYPEQGIATVNYVEFPTHRPVAFEITADAPMNSFWIPQLGGMIYAMPAVRTKLHLMADKPGDYRGSSSHFSGKGFAGMSFVARSGSEEAFNCFVKQVKRSGKMLSIQEYDHLTLPSSYVPPLYYRAVADHLFDRVIMKYLPEKRQ